MSLLLALLLGWQATAMRHALAHLFDASTDGPALPTHAVCVMCVAFAGADGAVAPSAPVVCVAIDADVVAGVQPIAIDVPVSSLPYQVRAPPLAVA
ncbi:hypothetical protein [Immundisolibacter sp.]|uniref:hypothetical protein n=1 Tax=Immundisolibacter sp. TaxID=1934948 RepID=UPI00261F931B|nr:hypothetical protein [Immundisolibacter sp.]MDD3649927.1 hypothetical protein [Immundisolibacter sp.]